MQNLNDSDSRPRYQRVATSCAVAAAIITAPVSFYFVMAWIDALPDPPPGVVAVFAVTVALLVQVKITQVLSDRVAARHTAVVHAALADLTASLGKLSDKIEELTDKVEDVRNRDYWMIYGQALRDVSGARELNGARDIPKQSSVTQLPVRPRSRQN